MFAFIRELLDSDTLSPHGICLLWQPGLIWTHVVADAIIAASYLSIPIVLASLVLKRDDIAFGWVFWCFVTFIVACGSTHVMSIVTLWLPAYGLEAVLKVVTAAASLGTAIALWFLLPRILALPSPRQLSHVNESLRNRILERDQAVKALEGERVERERTEAMLRQAQKMEAIGQLTGGMAHDFNNLLNIVIANLERAQRQLPRGATLSPLINDAMKGAESAAAMTHKLLAFARNQPLRPVSVDLNGLLRGLSRILLGAFHSRINVRFALASNLWGVRADQNQLECCIVNLAVNARDAMDADSPGRLTFTTANVDRSEAAKLEGLDPAEDYVVTEVADSGRGMTAETIKRASEPFFTTKPTGRGTGLGLSQVLGFAIQSGGHLTIESALGTGTRVRLYLPRHRTVDQSVGPEAMLAAH